MDVGSGIPLCTVIGAHVGSASGCGFCHLSHLCVQENVIPFLRNGM